MKPTSKAAISIFRSAPGHHKIVLPVELKKIS